GQPVASGEAPSPSAADTRLTSQGGADAADAAGEDAGFDADADADATDSDEDEDEAEGEDDAEDPSADVLSAWAQAQAATPEDHRCGFAAIVGRPNVGKSTLINALLGTKLSIVSHKPQTTRHRILGILTEPQWQIVFVDTPGLHAGARRAMNRHMNRAALASLQDADLNLFVVEALTWRDEDQRVLDELKRQGRPIVLVLNKVDKVFPRERLLPYMDEMARRADFAEMIPLSALKERNTATLPELIARHLPLSPPHFPPDQLTDRSP